METFKKQISKIKIPIFKKSSLFNFAKESVKEKIINFAKKTVELTKEKINKFSDRIISYIIPEKKKETIEQVKILKDDIQKIYKKSIQKKKVRIAKINETNPSENKKEENKVIKVEINKFRKTLQ